MGAVVHASKTLLRTAEELSIPTIVSTQYAKRFGDTMPEVGVQDMIDKGKNVNVYDKTRFSMITPQVQEDLALKKPKSIILCGIEAHVCVLQTCLDLIESGIDVHVVVDAVSSQRTLDRDVALKRMEQSGAYLTTVESVVFQLLEDSSHPNFKAISQLMKEHNAQPSPFQESKM